MTYNIYTGKLIAKNNDNPEELPLPGETEIVDLHPINYKEQRVCDGCLGDCSDSLMSIGCSSIDIGEE